MLDCLDRIEPVQADALRGALALGPPSGSPLTVAAGTLSLLAAAAEDGPVLVAIDDAHWLDHSSGACLLLAARRLCVESIAMVWVTCDPEPAALAGADLPHMSLEALSRPAAAELLGPRRSTSRPTSVT